MHCLFRKRESRDVTVSFKIHNLSDILTAGTLLELTKQALNQTWRLINNSCCVWIPRSSYNTTSYTMWSSYEHRHSVVKFSSISGTSTTDTEQKWWLNWTWSMIFLFCIFQICLLFTLTLGGCSLCPFLLYCTAARILISLREPAQRDQLKFYLSI